MWCVMLVAISWAVTLTDLNHLDLPCCCCLERSRSTPRDPRSALYRSFPGFICAALLTVAPDTDSFYITLDARGPMQVELSLV
jgi:hypothetical protein